MTSRILLFDKYMHYKTELANVKDFQRGWVLNGYGKGSFTIETTDPDCTIDNLQFGNLVHVVHVATPGATGNGILPTWTGIILPPQDWDKGKIKITVYGAEAILDFRAMPYVKVDNTPASVFTQLLTLAHKQSTNIIIQPGRIQDIKTNYTDKLKLSALAHIKKLSDTNQMDWDVIGSVSLARLNAGGTSDLQLFANLYDNKGSNPPFTLTEKNTEMSSPYLSIQGTPSNIVHGYSQAQTPATRWGFIGINQAAVDDYGPLELNKVFVGLDDQASVKSAAQAWATNNGRPTMRVGRKILNIDNNFDYLDIGNTLQIKERAGIGFLPDGTFGLDGSIRIIAMDYSDVTDSVKIVVDINPPVKNRDGDTGNRTGGGVTI